MKVKFQDGGKWCQLDAGGANFALSSPAEAPDGADGTVVVLQVDDLDAARGALESAGTAIEGERDMGSHGRVLTCRDPDGTLIQIYQKS
jgi:predicted enzyme related to lactoylglutathione lyase